MKRLRSAVWEALEFLLMIGVVILFLLYTPIEWVRCKIKHVPFYLPFEPEEWDS